MSVGRLTSPRARPIRRLWGPAGLAGDGRVGHGYSFAWESTWRSPVVETPGDYDLEAAILLEPGLWVGSWRQRRPGCRGRLSARVPGVGSGEPDLVDQVDDRPLGTGIVAGDRRVGPENLSTSGDLDVFVDQPTETIDP
jgi:hypothetical protein